MDAAAYVSALQGRPWSVERHCWALVEDVQRDLFGRDLPPVHLDERLTTRELARMFRDHPEQRRWREVSVPEHGAIALMHRGGGHARAIHAGVFLDLDGGGVLHVDEPHGVTFDGHLDLVLRNWTSAYFLPR